MRVEWKCVQIEILTAAMSDVEAMSKDTRGT